MHLTIRKTPFDSNVIRPWQGQRSGLRIENGGAIWLRERREVPVGLIDDLKGKAQGLIDGNEEAIKDGITKAGDFIDQKTGGKFAGHVDTVQNAASDFVDRTGTPAEAEAAEEAPAAEQAPTRNETPSPVFPGRS